MERGVIRDWWVWLSDGIVGGSEELAAIVTRRAGPYAEALPRAWRAVGFRRKPPSANVARKRESQHQLSYEILRDVLPIPAWHRLRCDAALERIRSAAEGKVIIDPQ